MPSDDLVRWLVEVRRNRPRVDWYAAEERDINRVDREPWPFAWTPPGSRDAGQTEC